MKLIKALISQYGWHFSSDLTGKKFRYKYCLPTLFVHSYWLIRFALFKKYPPDTALTVMKNSFSQNKIVVVMSLNLPSPKIIWGVDYTLEQALDFRNNLNDYISYLEVRDAMANK